MLGNKNDYFLLNVVVFIWGFTAILGKLINLDAFTLVWYRVLFTAISILFYMKVVKINHKISKKDVIKLLAIGIIIAVHWSTFYLAIKISNASITLAVLSTGAFFVSIIEPIAYRKKPVMHEMLLGIIVIIGVIIIMDVDENYKTGALVALLSTFISSLYSVITGKIAHKWNPSVSVFYQMIGAFLFLSIVIPFLNPKYVNFTIPTGMDLLYLIVLSTICTAYTFVILMRLMKTISAFTVVLTVNLEPIYGILMAYFIFTESETMSPKFYIGTIMIVLTVFLNTWIKRKKRLKEAIKQK